MELEKLIPVTTFNKTIELTENECIPPYKVQFRLRRGSRKGVFINLPSVKQNAKYLNNNAGLNPPKDCDAILLDLDYKKVYLVELKRSKASSTPKDIEEQLLAGERWWEHIAFCTDIELNDFEVFKVALVIGRGGSKIDRYKTNDRGYYRISGSRILCDYF